MSDEAYEYTATLASERRGVAPPLMTNLTAEQSAANERIFGQRYLTIQQRPEQGNRAQRRRRKRR